MHATAIIGLGNLYMSDEGIGPRVVAELLQREEPLQNVDVMDLGMNGFQVVHELAGRRKVVFVDCAVMGEPPGTLRRFTPEEVRTQKVQPATSSHGGDLLQTIRLARDMGDCAEEIVIFGVEPGRVEQGEGLSEELTKRLGEYVEAIVQEVRGCGFKVKGER